MSLSHGELNQMEAAAIHRQEDKEHLLLEQEIMGKWARGELVEVVRCKDCVHSELHGWYKCMKDGSFHYGDYYCKGGERKEKTDD